MKISKMVQMMDVADWRVSGRDVWADEIPLSVSYISLLGFPWQHCLFFLVLGKLSNSEHRNIFDDVFQGEIL